MYGIPASVFNTWVAPNMGHASNRGCGNGRRGGQAFNYAAFMPDLNVAASACHLPMDVVETKDAYTVTVDVPGFDAADVSVSLQDGVLTLAGKAAHRESSKDGRVLRRERATTSFTRSLELPERVDADNIKANLLNGVLTVTLPKVAPPQPKTIPVTVVAEPAASAAEEADAAAPVEALATAAKEEPATVPAATREAKEVPIAVTTEAAAATA